MRSAPGAFRLAALSCLFAVMATAEPPAAEVAIPSTRDGAKQPALLWIPPHAAAPSEAPPVPLLVFLHSWSARYNESEGLKDALAECRRRGWAFLSPNFRGPNDRPEACGSELAMQDILDAVAFARRRARIDGRRIRLLGGSGGGHMALMMAARAPRLWAAVSAWVPIADLAAWHAFSKSAGNRYQAMLEKCCGGPPGALDAVPAAPRPRAAGRHRRRIRDGHDGPVPVSHSLRAFNELARANGFANRALSAEEIDEFTSAARVPESLAGEVEEEAGRKHKVLFRRWAGPVRLTVFDGGHVMDVGAGVNWLAAAAAPE